MNPSMPQKWRELLGTWGVDDAASDRWFADIETRYAGPDRFYHTLDHVRSVLECIETLAPSAGAVALAGWLHDVVYDTRAADNEERSAAYAEALCRELSIAEGERVAELIRTTKTHADGDGRDAQVLLDADLAILGADGSVYEIYAAQVRQEYAWVPVADYRAGRLRVLESFLARPRIYRLLTHLEASARRNLTAEIARLRLNAP